MSLSLPASASSPAAAVATTSACFFIFSGSARTLTSVACICARCASMSVFATRSACARSAPSARSLLSFCSAALCLSSSARTSATCASSASICGWSSAACRFWFDEISSSSSVRTPCRSCISCWSSMSRSSRMASSDSPLLTSALSEAIVSESSCARIAVFSSLPRSALSSWFSCFAFLSRFFSFSYVLSTTSWSLAYLLL